MIKRAIALGICLFALTACPETKARINNSWAEWCDSHEICQPDQGPIPPAGAKSR